MEFDVGRRALILAGLGLTLAGCADREPAIKPTGSATARPTGRAAPSSSATPPASPTPSPPALPTREEVVARFTGMVPQQWGLDVPGVLSSLPAAAGGAVLTLDYCGGPGGSQTDHAIFDILRERRVPATLFLNYRWIEVNHALAQELAKDPLFEIANHGTQHLPLSVSGQSAYGIPGTVDPGGVYDEVMMNTAAITALAGRPPRFFRSGTAHLDEVAAQICLALGQIPTGFSINGDAGATHPAHLVTQELTRAQPGDIIIAHGNQPASGTGTGVAAALTQRENLGVRFISMPPRLPEASLP